MHTTTDTRYLPTPGNAQFTEEIRIDNTYPDYSFYRSNDGGAVRGFQVLGKKGLYVGKPVEIVLMEYSHPNSPIKLIPLATFKQQVEKGLLIPNQPKEV